MKSFWTIADDLDPKVLSGKINTFSLNPADSSYTMTLCY